MDDLNSFCGLDPDCKDRGRREAGNLRVHSRTGRRKRYLILLCRTCGGRSSERKGTTLFRSHLPEAKEVSILEHLNEGNGVR